MDATRHPAGALVMRLIHIDRWSWEAPNLMVEQILNRRAIFETTSNGQLGI